MLIKTSRTGKALLLLSSLGITAFISQEPITVDSIREFTISGLFSEDKDSDTDTTVFYKDFNEYEKKEIIVYPFSYCGADPAVIVNNFRYKLDTAYVGFADPSIVTRCKTLFGQSLLKGQLKMAEKDYDGNPMLFDQYSAPGLQAAFNKLYQKPTSTYKGIALQKIYNLSMKNYFREVTEVIVDVMSRKLLWESESKRFLQQAMNNPSFDASGLTNEIYNKILGEDYKKDCIGYPGNMIGTMLRRQCDGSLPTLLICLKTVLKDYDPEFYNKVAPKF